MPNKDLLRVTLDVNADIIEFSEGASIITGYSSSEVVGKNWFKLFIPEENFDEVSAVFQGFLGGNLSFWEYTNRIICKDGLTCVVKWKNFLRRDAHNNPIAIHSEGNLI